MGKGSNALLHSKSEITWYLHHQLHGDIYIIYTQYPENSDNDFLALDVCDKICLFVCLLQTMIQNNFLSDSSQTRNRQVFVARVRFVVYSHMREEKQ